MDWIEYKVKFLKAAKKENKSKEYCDRWLMYAYKLWEKHLPIIYTQEHLCELVGFEAVYIYSVSNSSFQFYKHYQIPKKNGGMRKIDEPLPNLKEIQKWILENILYHMEVSLYAKAYIRGKSIKDNVRFHRRQKKVLSLDIKDFYGHLTSWMVYQIFLEYGYSESVSMLLTGLCCENGVLPQGAPTSAALSNLIMKEIDNQIAIYCREQQIRYTRYADDMTFSGDFDERKVITTVKQILKPLNLSLNEKKTRVRKQGQQQEVTGIIVNYKAQISKKNRKEIRKNMYYIQKYGLQEHLKYLKEGRNNYLEHLLGQINYGLFINSTDYELQKYKEELMKIRKL